MNNFKYIVMPVFLITLIFLFNVKLVIENIDIEEDLISIENKITNTEYKIDEGEKRIDDIEEVLVASNETIANSKFVISNVESKKEKMTEEVGYFKAKTEEYSKRLAYKPFIPRAEDSESILHSYFMGILSRHYLKTSYGYTGSYDLEDLEAYRILFFRLSAPLIEGDQPSYKKAIEILESLDVYGKSEKEVINSILKYVINNVEYSQEFLDMQDNGESTDIIYNDVSSKEYFYDGNSGLICSGYVDIFSHLLYMMGIENYAVISNMYEEEEYTANHSWTKVILSNGEEYYFDLTWADVENKYIDYTYLWSKEKDFGYSEDRANIVVLDGRTLVGFREYSDVSAEKGDQ